MWGIKINGHVTEDVTWPLKVLWGSTVAYHSDSLASCPTTKHEKPVNRFHINYVYECCLRLIVTALCIHYMAQNMLSQTQNVRLSDCLSHRAGYQMIAGSVQCESNPPPRSYL